MKKFILLFLLLIPVVNALDCKNVADQTNCNYVLNSGISSSDANYLISDLSYQNSDSPNFNLVYNWNTAVDTSKPLANQKMFSSGVIKNAWVKALAVMPSVISDNQLLVSGKGSFQCTYGYSIQLPTLPMPNDCKTLYKLKSQSAEVKDYVNGVYQGSGKLVSFQSDASSQTFTSTLNVQASTQITHYQPYTYCCAHGFFGECTAYCTICKYHDTEIKKDSLSISDSIKAQKEVQAGEYQFNVLNNYNGNTKIQFNSSKASAFEINFANSNLRKTSYLYVPNFSTSYNIMTLVAVPFEKLSYDNLLFTNNNTFLVKDVNGCNIVLFSHFNQSSYNCNLTYNPLKISVDTDKFSYFANETIKVNLIPNDVVMNVTYGTISRLVRGSTEFKVEVPYNRITAQYGDSISDKVIFLKAEDQWNSAFSLGTFAGANYLLLLLVKTFKRN